jgi:hypothetical protein
MTAADCEARYYGDQRWYPARRLDDHTVLFVGFEAEGPQETQRKDVRKLGWGKVRSASAAATISTG